jgi:hypothetical protein
LEAKEIYIKKLDVDIIIGMNKDNIENNKICVEKCKGHLHLCSRSFIFEPLEFNLPIMKIKFSSNLQSK